VGTGVGAREGTYLPTTLVNRQMFGMSSRKEERNPVLGVIILSPAYVSTLANWTPLILFSKMLKFSKNYFFQIKKIL